MPVEVGGPSRTLRLPQDRIKWSSHVAHLVQTEVSTAHARRSSTSVEATCVHMAGAGQCSAHTAAGMPFNVLMSAIQSTKIDQ